MVKLHINDENLKNARTSETFPGTSPIFAISSNDSDSSKTNDSSNKDVPSSTTRRWTQVCGFFKITNDMCESLKLFKLILRSLSHIVPYFRLFPCCQCIYFRLAMV